MLANLKADYWGLLFSAVLTACGSDSRLTVPEMRSQANPQAQAAARGERLTSAGLKIIADLTPFRLLPPKYTYIGTSLPSGTIQNYLGSLQSIDGYYYTVDPLFEIARYKSQYYLLPRGTKWGQDKYGWFCGGNWGYPGNSLKEPVADGGLDAACRSHDIAWTAGTAANVRAGDAAFLAALKRISPRWQYEADYSRDAQMWMFCRVSKSVSQATPFEPKCGALVVSLVSASLFESRVIR